MVELAFSARRRLSGLRRELVRAGRFEIPMLVGGPIGDPCPLVLLHGFSDSKDSFVDVARVLTRTRRVMMPDLPGFSEASQPLDHHYTVPSIAGLLMEALGGESPGGVHIVGNSLGGAIAAFITLERPQWVRSLTLIAAAGLDMPVPSALQRHIEADLGPFSLRSEEEYPAFLRFVLERVPVIPGPVLRMMGRRLVERREMNERILAQLVEDELDLTSRLGEIDVPTMVLWGDRDRLIDLSVGRVYHQAIAGSRMVVLHGVGHCPQVEAPRPTVRRILETVTMAESGA